MSLNKIIQSILIAVFGFPTLLLIVNYFIRVSGIGAEESTGIIYYYLFESKSLLIRAMIITAQLIGVSVATFLYANARRGHLIGVNLFKFEKLYDDILVKQGSKQIALKGALQIFKECPTLKKLSDDDIEKFVSIIGILPDPKNIVDKIVLRLDSAKALKAFRDEAFLREIALVYGRTNEVYGTKIEDYH